MSDYLRLRTTNKSEIFECDTTLKDGWNGTCGKDLLNETNTVSQSVTSSVSLLLTSSFGMHHYVRAITCIIDVSQTKFSYFPPSDLSDFCIKLAFNISRKETTPAFREKKCAGQKSQNGPNLGFSAYSPFWIIRFLWFCILWWTTMISSMKWTGGY